MAFKCSSNPRATLIGALLGCAFLAGCSAAVNPIDGFVTGDSGPNGPGVADAARNDEASPAATEGANGAGTGVVEAGTPADAGSQAAADAGAPVDAHASADASGAQDASGIADAGRDTGVVADSGIVASDAGICADQAAWLTPMNQARAMVGEAPLVCNPVAAQVALAYASQCNYAHNANRNTDYTALGGSGGLGENIAAGTPTETIAAAVSSWVNEVQWYNHATNTCATGQQCGHYTQIVWKTTTAVGCVHVSCTTNSPFGATGNGRWDFSVCDYSPPGNFVGQSPY